MASAGPQSSAERRDEARPRPPSAKVTDAALLLFACAAFVVAKSIATGGRVHIDDVEYWLLGALPLALLYGLAALAARWCAPVTPIARRFVAAWAIALTLFCLSRDFQLYQTLTSGFGVRRGTTGFGDLAAASLLSAAGAAIAMPGFVRDAANRLAASAFALALLLANAVMLALLVLL